MLNRYKVVGLQVLRDRASMPLWTLGMAERGQVLQKETTSMVCEIKGRGEAIRYITPTPLVQARPNSAFSKVPNTIEWIERPAAYSGNVGANFNA